MGSEFAQIHEWNHDGEIDWGLLSDPAHAGVQRLVSELNRLYRSESALHERDAESSGFRWIVGNDASNSVYAYERHAGDTAPIITIVNMTPVPRHNYRIGVPRDGFWREHGYRCVSARVPGLSSPWYSFLLRADRRLDDTLEAGTPEP